MQDNDTRCVHQLSDLTNARLSRPKVAYTEVGKVKSANNLCLVIDLFQSDTYHARRSTAPVPAGGAGVGYGLTFRSSNALPPLAPAFPFLRRRRCSVPGQPQTTPSPTSKPGKLRVSYTGANTSAPGDDEAYRGAFEKILATVSMLHDRGVFIVFGTDTGGSFTYHRELELYQRAGMTPPEILKRATYDSAKYVGQDQRLGSIEKGKLADFFLVPGDPTKELKAVKTIRMVVKDGTFYYPSEVYPKFGIEPFTSAPTIKQAAENR